MKKSTKLVILFLAVALIVGAFAFAISANDDAVISYVDSSNTTVTTSSMAEAMANVKDGGTVTLGSNLTVTEPIVISKRVTLDLGGYCISNISTNPLFNVTYTNGEQTVLTPASAADVSVIGAGYIETRGLLLSLTTNAHVAFKGAEYGIHVNLRNQSVGAAEVSNGVLSFSLTEIKVDVDAPKLDVIKATGGIVSGDRFGIVCERKLASATYAYNIGGEAVAMLQNCYVNTTSNIFYVSDGAKGYNMAPAGDGEGAGGAQTVADGSGSSSEMPEATIDESLLAYEKCNSVVIAVSGGIYTHISPEGDAYNQTVVQVAPTITNGVSGMVVFGETEIVTSSILVDTPFGSEAALDEDLYKDFYVVFASTDVFVSNYGKAGGGYLFGGRVAAKLVMDSTFEVGAIPFSSKGLPTFTGGAPLVYVEEGVRFDRDVPNFGITEEDPVGTVVYSCYSGYDFVYDPFGPARTPYVFMDAYTEQERVGTGTYDEFEVEIMETVTHYRNPDYERITKRSANQAEFTSIDFESYVRDTFSNATSPAGLGIGAANRGGGQIRIEYNDTNAYYTYRMPSHKDTINPATHSGVTNQYFFDEKAQMSWYVGSAGYLAVGGIGGDKALVTETTSFVTVREFNFAAPEAGFTQFSFANMSYQTTASTGPMFGPSMTVYTNGEVAVTVPNPDGEGNKTVNGQAYTDGRWNRLVLVTKISYDESNPDSKVLYQTTFFLNPGTDEEFIATTANYRTVRITGELRVSENAGEKYKVPYGAGCIIDDVTSIAYERVDNATFAPENYLRTGPGTETSGYARKTNIKVNGKMMPSLDYAFKYAQSIGSYVTVNGDVVNSQHISESTPDGYVVVTGDYLISFDSEKAAKYTPDAIGENTSTFFFSNTVYGAGKPVDTNWYFGTDENVLDDIANFHTAGAVRGTYPKQPNFDVPPVVIGDRFYVFDGWVANEYLWYGDYATPAEYEAAKAKLAVGIKTITYEDLVYGYGPTYYPVYKDSGVPAFIITNPSKLPAGHIEADLFPEYFAKFGANDTLKFNVDYAVSIGSTAVVEGTKNAPVVINIDLAGRTVDISANAPIVKIGSYVTLNVYSSLAGGKLNVIGNTYAFEMAKGAVNSSINIGEANGKSGRNLEINAAGLVVADGDESCSVNLIGGIYVKSMAMTSAFITARNEMGAVTVDGATLVAAAGNSLFFGFEVDEARVAYTIDNFVVKNSTVVAASTADTVMKLAQYARLAIENSTVYGRLGNSTDKVIVGKGTSYVKLSGSNAIVGIASYNESNLLNAIRSDKAIVYASAGLKSAGLKMPKPMFTYFGGANFESSIYVTTNQSGQKVCVAPAGADVSAIEADVVIFLGDLNYEIVESEAKEVTVYWLTLEHDKTKYLGKPEIYLSTSTPKYLGVDPEPYAYNALVTRVFDGTWKADESEIENGVIYMYPGYILESELTGTKASAAFDNGIIVKFYIPIEYYEVLSIETRASLLHELKEVAGKKYYYVTGLEATADADIIAKLEDIGATLESGEYLIPEDMYVTLSKDIKALLAPTIENDGGDYLVITKSADIKNSVSGTEIPVSIVSGGVTVDYIGIVSVKDCLKLALADAVAADNANMITLLCHLVDYLDKAYDYYRIFETVDDESYDFTDDFDTIIKISDKLSAPTFEDEPSDTSALAGVATLSVDVSSIPKFIITITDPKFDGTVTIAGITYTVDDAERIRGRYVFTYVPLSTDKYNDVFDIVVDDGTDEYEAQYSLADYAESIKNSPKYLTDMISSFRNYVYCLSNNGQESE